MNRDAGFSLIELMCAILILGVGLVVLTHGISTALTSSKESELQTAASLIAAGRIETLRAEPYIIEGEAEGDCGANLPLYIWKESIRTTRIEGLYEVDVVVEHAKTGEAIYDLQTMLFDPPILSSSSQNSRERSSDRRRRNR